ncbi:MAG: hypothetical protein ACE5J5_05795 [Candidatus Hydrothermarchaeales archaeon]
MFVGVVGRVSLTAVMSAVIQANVSPTGKPKGNTARVPTAKKLT